MARFFIDRPVFAWVIAILIMMAGGISIFRLPVEQYPRIAPPVVTITAKYSGASAQTLEDTVAQVIEQKLNGIDGLLYINSTSDAAGQVSIRLTFDPDTNPDVAQMQVQNKLQLATSSLPEEVTRQGITVTKVADSFLQMYAFVSSDDSMSAADLCDFVGSTILDPLSRVDGVGEVSLFGAPYAMRIWLNPSKLLSYSLTPSDVINAVKAQNKQVSLGEVGGKPIRDCYEATGHARAYDYMLETARGGPLQFREEDILRLHALFYGGIDPEHAGRYREGQVFITGTEYAPPTAEEEPGLMAGLVEELNKRRDAMHPVLLAAYAHRRLVDIHPFQDGNGRTARLLMNLILVNRGYCVVSIPPILRHDYITALQQAQRAQGPSDTAFIRLICECELEAQKDYCRMFRIKLPERRKDAPER